MAKRITPSAEPVSSWLPFAFLALGAFLAALGVLSLMLWKAEMLVRLGLAGNLYYVVLVTLGLCVAAFLFGVLKSYAVYTGDVASGKLELGGPIVGFLLVVILGITLVPSPRAFAVTVFVHGEGGRQDVVLRNRGAVILDLGADRRREAIGDKGQAIFAGIPAPFRGQTVSVALEADGYEIASPKQSLTLDGDSIYLSIRAKTAHLMGYVRTTDGQPVRGATISVAGHQTVTDDFGYFALSVSGRRADEKATETLQVTAPGFKSWSSTLTPGGNEVTVLLEPSDVTPPRPSVPR